MKRFALGLFIVWAIYSSHAETRVSPAQPDRPAFELFEPAPGPGQSPSWNLKQPLLSVSKIKSIRLATTGADYLLTFTDTDAKSLAEITQNRVGKLLIVISDGEVVVVLRIKAPIIDGVMQIYRGAETSSIDAFVEKLKNANNSLTNR